MEGGDFLLVLCAAAAAASARPRVAKKTETSYSSQMQRAREGLLCGAPWASSQQQSTLDTSRKDGEPKTNCSHAQRLPLYRTIEFGGTGTCKLPVAP